MERKLNYRIELKGKVAALEKGQSLSDLSFNEYRSALRLAKTLHYKLKGDSDENGKHAVVRIK